MKRRPARLDSKLIKQAIKSFPTGRGWSTLACSRLRSKTGTTRDWKVLSHVSGRAGLYVFLLPKARFRLRYVFLLDGPARRRIPFAFSVKDLPTVKRKYFVAYVGRTANLLQRLQWHFQKTKRSTAAQVRKALIKCGYARDPSDAIDFMLTNCLIVYRCLPNDRNVGNRDIIEVALWARYRSPFNIKSER